MNVNAANYLRKNTTHILICDVDKFNVHLLRFLIDNVYGCKPTIKLDTIRIKLEAELKWTLDEPLPVTHVLREWLDNKDYPLVAITGMSYETCTELIKQFPDNEVTVYSWMRHESSTPF